MKGLNKKGMSISKAKEIIDKIKVKDLMDTKNIKFINDLLYRGVITKEDLVSGKTFTEIISAKKVGDIRKALGNDFDAAMEVLGFGDVAKNIKELEGKYTGEAEKAYISEMSIADLGKAEPLISNEKAMAARVKAFGDSLTEDRAKAIATREGLTVAGIVNGTTSEGHIYRYAVYTNRAEELRKAGIDTSDIAISVITDSEGIVDRVKEMRKAGMSAEKIKEEVLMKTTSDKAAKALADAEHTYKDTVTMADLSDRAKKENKDIRDLMADMTGDRFSYAIYENRKKELRAIGIGEKEVDAMPISSIIGLSAENMQELKGMKALDIDLDTIKAVLKVLSKGNKDAKEQIRTGIWGMSVEAFEEMIVGMDEEQKERLYEYVGIEGIEKDIESIRKKSDYSEKTTNGYIGTLSVRLVARAARGSKEQINDSIGKYLNRKSAEAKEKESIGNVIQVGDLFGLINTSLGLITTRANREKKTNLTQGQVRRMLLSNCGVFAANAAGMGITDTKRLVELAVKMVGEMTGAKKIEGLKVAGKGKAVDMDTLIEMTGGQEITEKDISKVGEGEITGVIAYLESGHAVAIKKVEGDRITYSESGIRGKEVVNTVSKEEFDKLGYSGRLIVSKEYMNANIDKIQTDIKEQLTEKIYGVTKGGEDSRVVELILEVFDKDKVKLEEYIGVETGADEKAIIEATMARISEVMNVGREGKLSMEMVRTEIAILNGIRDMLIASKKQDEDWLKKKSSEQILKEMEDVRKVNQQVIVETFNSKIGTKAVEDFVIDVTKLQKAISEEGLKEKFEAIRAKMLSGANEIDAVMDIINGGGEGKKTLTPMMSLRDIHAIVASA